jgi:hypothetical protein
MKPSPLLLVATLTLTFANVSHSQNPPGVTAGTEPPGGKPGTTTAAAGQKPKPFSSGESHALLGIADSLQFQMNLAQRLASKLRISDPQTASLAARIQKETTQLWTPMVDLATAHGIEGKKIPMTVSKGDKAAADKLNTLKEEDKWKVAFVDLFAKEARKNVRGTEAAAKSATDPDLKAWLEKALAVLAPQAEQLETAHKELKSPKKK